MPRFFLKTPQTLPTPPFSTNTIADQHTHTHTAKYRPLTQVSWTARTHTHTNTQWRCSRKPATSYFKDLKTAFLTNVLGNKTKSSPFPLLWPILLFILCLRHVNLSGRQLGSVSMKCTRYCVVAVVLLLELVPHLTSIGFTQSLGGWMSLTDHVYICMDLNRLLLCGVDVMNSQGGTYWRGMLPSLSSSIILRCLESLGKAPLTSSRNKKNVLWHFQHTILAKSVDRCTKYNIYAVPKFAVVVQYGWFKDCPMTASGKDSILK